MRYLVRLNPKAFNPITRKVIAERLWEVEQCANKDSEKVIWHAREVRINGVSVRQFFTLSKDGEKPWEREYFGTCARDYDDAIEIRTTSRDASGG